MKHPAYLTDGKTNPHECEVWSHFETGACADETITPTLATGHDYTNAYEQDVVVRKCQVRIGTAGSDYKLKVDFKDGSTVIATRTLTSTETAVATVYDVPLVSAQRHRQIDPYDQITIVTDVTDEGGGTAPQSCTYDCFVSAFDPAID